MTQTKFDNFGIIRVRKTDPEIFWLAWNNPREPKTPGFFMQTSRNLSEKELRAELGKMGLGEPDITELVESARRKSDEAC